jgi:hypothetical membrane protein
MKRSGAGVLVGSFLAFAYPARSAEVRGPSTSEERAHFVEQVRALEKAPLGENANVTRRRLRQWTIEVPDIRFEVCPDLLGGAFGDEYPYSREIDSQVVLSGAVLTIEHPGEARDDVAVYTAGVEGALRAYEVVAKSRADGRLAALDDLLEKRRRGELRDHIAKLSEENCPRSSARLIAAPAGAVAGLLMALLAARWFGRSRGRPLRAVILRKIVFLSAAYYVIAGIALHFLEPEYDPRFFPMSHYAWGAYGWLMTTTFFVLGLALFTVAMGLRTPDPSSTSTRIGLGWLMVGALFVCLAGVFRSFPLHDVASAIALPSVSMAVLLLSWTFGRASGWDATSRAAVLLAAGMFAALLSVILDVGMPGLQQRTFLLLLLLWLSLVAHRQVRVAAG